LAAFILHVQAGLEISGRVVNATTGEPIAGAQINLFPAPGSAMGYAVVGLTGRLSAVPPPARFPQTLKQIPALTTTSDGRFSFKDLTPGVYRLNAGANGYVRQPYGQRGMNAQGTAISLVEGKSPADLTIQLTPTGTVTGHVLDDSGRPAVDAPVQLLRVFYGPDGRRLQAVASGYADDRGEYRLYGLTPGRYYLAAGNVAGPQPRPLGAVNPNQVMRVYGISFYPGVTELNEATLIEVKTGTELIVDMRAAPQQTHRITGRVVNSDGGPAPSSVNINLAYRNLTGGSGSFGAGRNYDPATGAFELQDVVPGDYVLQASVQIDRPPLPPSSAADAVARQAAVVMPPRAELPIRVGNSDVSGVVLALTTGASIPGHVTIEGTSSSGLQAVTGVRVAFRPMWNGLPNPSSPAPNPSPIATDGSFHLDNVRDGEYIATIFGIPADMYIKRAEVGGQEILGRTFAFSSAAPAALEVVLGTNPARLQGTVSDSQGRPAVGAQVVLIPSERTRSDLFKTAFTDQKGHFTIAGMPPGDYKLFSWDSIEPFEYFDPDFLKTYQSRGHVVHLDEGSMDTADIRVIPIAD